MTKNNKWQLFMALILISLSLLFYVIHFLIFKDLHHILIYFIGDIAFLFFDVLIVMLVLQRLLEHRDKRIILKKLNMVIGVFFREVGTELLKRCSQFDESFSELGKHLILSNNSSEKEFTRLHNFIKKYKVSINSKKGNLYEIKDFLLDKKSFLLNLLANPNLLEHDDFTELLWAVFHFTDELAHRKNFSDLPENDYHHLTGDMKRAYHQLILQWIDYMKHLQKDYPYIFSLAIRTNPFDETASVEVK